MKLLYLFTIMSSFNIALLADQEFSKTIQHIGIIGCMKPKDAPTLSHYLNTPTPDLMIWVGDNVYADAKTVTQLESTYEQLAKRKHIKEIRKIETMATWDDHDYGINNSGASNPIKKESKEIFSKFWKLPDFVKKREGIYYAKIFGQGKQKVQIIMLDCRYSKTSQQMISEEQWKWLGEQLTKDAQIRLIVSGQQVLTPKNTKFEAWSKVGNEQKRLFNLLKSNKTAGVIFITGDQHYAETLKQNKALGYDAWEFMFGGVNQNEKACPAAVKYRVDLVNHTHKSAFLKINWNGSPSVTYKVFNEKGEQLLTREIKIADLRK